MTRSSSSTAVAASTTSTTNRHFLSEGLTRITDPVSGDNYALAWYEDKTGFVWDGHGDFIRDDSEIGKAAVERWEANCGIEWLG